jgi:predicted phosphohydrolase
MKLHLMSDLHLEFAPIDLPGGDVLLLAGDVCVADYLRPTRTDRSARLISGEIDAFFEEACSKYNKVVYIAGNHEHYHGVLQDTNNILANYLNKFEVAFLDNSCFELNDEYVIFGSTLWTDFNNNNFSATRIAKNGMNDFRTISYKEAFKNGKLTPYDTTELNLVARNSLEMALEFYLTKKFIVMTHHLPDMDSVHPKYGNDEMNYAYANTGLKQFIKDNPRIKYWFHGHTHTSCDYMIDDCRVVCNPRGYAKPNRPLDCENKLFNINMTVEI